MNPVSINYATEMYTPWSGGNVLYPYFYSVSILHFMWDRSMSSTIRLSFK